MDPRSRYLEEQLGQVALWGSLDANPNHHVCCRMRTWLSHCAAKWFSWQLLHVPPLQGIVDHAKRKAAAGITNFCFWGTLLEQGAWIR